MPLTRTVNTPAGGAMLGELFAQYGTLHTLHTYRHDLWAAWLFSCLFKTLNLKICSQNSDSLAGEIKEKVAESWMELKGRKVWYVSSLCLCLFKAWLLDAFLKFQISKWVLKHCWNVSLFTGHNKITPATFRNGHYSALTSLSFSLSLGDQYALTAWWLSLLRGGSQWLAVISPFWCFPSCHHHYHS